MSLIWLLSSACSWEITALTLLSWLSKLMAIGRPLKLVKLMASSGKSLMPLSFKLSVMLALLLSPFESLAVKTNSSCLPVSAALMAGARKRILG